MSELLAFAAGLLVMYGVFFLAGLYARRVDAATAAETRERYRIQDEQFERLITINERGVEANERQALLMDQMLMQWGER